MDFVSLTIGLLKAIAGFVGNWGVAIIILTLIVRMILWPSSVSQQRSMRSMQQLQPKMKMIQERYKSDPQTMQRKMMEFYKENKFNPMAGCLPMLFQLPVFILLYSALISPQFIEQAGHAKFLFINRLDATIKSNAGLSFDGQFQVGKYDKFSLGKKAKVFFKDGTVNEAAKVDNPAKAVTVQGEITPSMPVDLKVALDSISLSFAELRKIDKVEVDVLDVQTRETEKITFKNTNDVLTASVPTIEVKSEIHYEVIFLVLLFAATMWLSQKVMLSQQKNAQIDPTQASIQKMMGTMMPIMICFTFVIIPIPAGVLLYLVTSNIFQIVQTLVINKQLEAEDAKKVAEKRAVKEDQAVEDAKVIEAKEVN